MVSKAFMVVPGFLLILGVLSVTPFCFEWSGHAGTRAIQQGNLKVHNLNTGKSYQTIQEAINAAETLDGHEISVGSGTYHEHVVVNKSLSLIGEDRSTTIIDGDGTGRVVYVTADNVDVREFTIQSGRIGLLLDRSRNSRIVGNRLRYGSYGIRLSHCRNSEVVDNNVRGYTWFGVEIESSGNSTLRGNSLVDNEYNFKVDGDSLSDFINDIDVSNTVNGKPIRYLIDQHDFTVDSSTFQEIGYLGFVNCTNIRVKNLNVQDNVQGVLMAFTTNSAISGVNAKNNMNGIYVAYSLNVSVNGNNANNNYDYGIKFFNSPRSIARGNNADNNVWSGIGVFKSPNSTVEGNEANFNTYDLHLVYTNNSVIARNHAVTKPGAGKRYSIAVYYSHNNLIYHNTFDSSRLHVETRNETPFTPRNSWDNGLEGNYWSHYQGVDADLDGISDTPYVVGENNVDNHPLMGRFSDFCVTFAGKNYSVSAISNSTISQFHFSPKDGEISFMAAGENATTSFSRIAVPNSLLQQLPSGNLTFLINAEQPVLKRKWTDETKIYFYFSYVSSACETAIDPWLLLVAASICLISFVVFLVLKKTRWKPLMRDEELSWRRMQQQ